MVSELLVTGRHARPPLPSMGGAEEKENWVLTGFLFSMLQETGLRDNLLQKTSQDVSFSLVFSCLKIAIRIPVLLWEGAALTALLPPPLFPYCLQSLHSLPQLP